MTRVKVGQTDVVNNFRCHDMTPIHKIKCTLRLKVIVNDYDQNAESLIEVCLRCLKTSCSKQK